MSRCASQYVELVCGCTPAGVRLTHCRTGPSGRPPRAEMMRLVPARAAWCARFALTTAPLCLIAGSTQTTRDNSGWWLLPPPWAVIAAPHMGLHRRSRPQHCVWSLPTRACSAVPSWHSTRSQCPRAEATPHRVLSASAGWTLATWPTSASPALAAAGPTPCFLSVPRLRHVRAHSEGIGMHHQLFHHRLTLATAPATRSAQALCPERLAQACPRAHAARSSTPPPSRSGLPASLPARNHPVDAESPLFLTKGSVPAARLAAQRNPRPRTSCGA
jgi:hypothetical protein